MNPNISRKAEEYTEGLNGGTYYEGLEVADVEEEANPKSPPPPPPL